MSKCENCIHYERCDHYHIATDTGKYAYPNIDLEKREDVEDICDDFKSKSLFVELPCKVGDEVYITDYVTNVIEAFVSGIDMFYNYLTKKVDTSVDLRIIGNFELHKNFDDFGKTVFLTKEEAEKKLKEMG